MSKKVYPNKKYNRILENYNYELSKNINEIISKKTESMFNEILLNSESNQELLEINKIIRQLPIFKKLEQDYLLVLNENKELKEKVKLHIIENDVKKENKNIINNDIFSDLSSDNLVKDAAKEHEQVSEAQSEEEEEQEEEEEAEEEADEEEEEEEEEEAEAEEAEEAEKEKEEELGIDFRHMDGQEKKHNQNQNHKREE